MNTEESQELSNDQRTTISSQGDVMSLRNGYVFVEDPPGYVVQAETLASKFEAITEFCAQGGTNKVLIQSVDPIVSMDTLDLFTSGSGIGESRLQVAFYVRGLNVAKEDVTFFENVSHNRGGGVAFFDDAEAALKWLGVSEPRK